MGIIPLFVVIACQQVEWITKYSNNVHFEPTYKLLFVPQVPHWLLYIFKEKAP